MCVCVCGGEGKGEGRGVASVSTVLVVVTLLYISCYSKTFGCVLVLHGVIQCTENDEIAYQMTRLLTFPSSYTQPKKSTLLGLDILCIF